jgi:coproporphyrinogen III oxidase-like Fe-S oxidoreductase
MTGLRTLDGFSKHQLTDAGHPLNSDQLSALHHFESKGWLQISNQRVSPTEKGFWWSDKMASELFIV